MNHKKEYDTPCFKTLQSGGFHIFPSSATLHRWTVFFTLIAWVLCTGPANAGKDDNKKDEDKKKEPKESKDLVIISAEPDLENGTLLISGRNFWKKKETPEAILYVSEYYARFLEPMDQMSFDNGVQQILVMLPENIEDYPGSFLLGVRSGKGKNQQDSFSLTIGAVGPKGSPGLPGPIGQTGASGAIGEQGPSGLRGETGPQGLAGPQGVAGEQGIPGPQGELGSIGPQGVAGSQGEQGSLGLPGEQGIPGPQGAPGLIGPMGLTGSQGEQGSLGLPGEQGIPGPQGDVGPEGPEGPAGESGAGSGNGPVTVSDFESTGLHPLQIYSKLESSPDAFTVLMIHSDTSDGATSFVDSSSSIHTITPVGNVHHTDSVSKFGASSMDFDGSGDMLQIGPSTDFNFGTGPFTIDFWARRPELTGDNYAFVLRPSDTYHFSIDLWKTQLQVNYNGIVTNHREAFSSANTWYHIAVVRSGGTIYAFSNGELVDTISILPTLYFSNDGETPLIGVQPSNPLHDMLGQLDEYRISKGIARWTSNFTPDTSPYPSGTTPRLYFRDASGIEYRVTATRVP